jgi:hypothetical protein
LGHGIKIIPAYSQEEEPGSRRIRRQWFLPHMFHFLRCGAASVMKIASRVKTILIRFAGL